MGQYSLIALSIVTCAGTARAALPVEASLNVAFEDCKEAPLGTAAFLRALGIELGNSTIAGGSDSTPQIAVKLGCDGVAMIRIGIEPSSEERAIRLDDVPTDERPRALALAIAELVRSKARADADADADVQSIQTARAATAPGAPVPGEAEAVAPPSPSAREDFDSPERTNAPATESGGTRRGFWCGAGARLSMDVGNASYGGHAGMSRGTFRLQADVLFSHARVSRGAIDAGLAAVRLRRALPLVAAPHLEVELDLSGALGAAWALGSSDVPGTIAERVLAPYVDVTVGAALALPSASRFTPDLELYIGRAASTVARADGVATLAIGGWFIGLEAGLRL